MFLYCLLIYLVGGISASLTYHRLLCHKCAELQPWLEKFLILLALPAGTPIQWVATHRKHHMSTDAEEDPHSPHNQGFWYAHCGWYIGQKSRWICLLYALAGPIRWAFDAFYRPRSNQQYIHLAADIAQKPFVSFVSKPKNYTWLMLVYLGIVVTPVLWFWGITGLLSIWLTFVLVYNIGDSLDSVGHLFGEKTNTHNHSRNNFILMLLAFGEGLHAYHHRFPAKAKLAHQWYHVDLGYMLLQFFALLGLAKNIRT